MCIQLIGYKVMIKNSLLKERQLQAAGNKTDERERYNTKVTNL